MSPLPGTKQLQRARQAASKRGLAADLTINDWHQTCADQEQRCAYCGTPIVGNGSLDRFLPLTSGIGGTCVTNCLLSCPACNLRKGGEHPALFLVQQPHTLARCWAYLVQRVAGQGTSPFWSILAAHPKELPMNEMKTIPQQLASGMSVSLLTDEQQIVLQLRQPAGNPTDPLAISFQVATRLTAAECLALATTLLQAASAKVEQVSTQPSASPWDLRAS